jgi:hypothetical protein
MATVLRVWTQEEVRSVIRFLWAKGSAPIEIHHEIQAVYGSNVMTKRFKSRDDVKHEVQTWLRGQDPIFCRQGFEKWISRLDKRLNREGDYVER